MRRTLVLAIVAAAIAAVFPSSPASAGAPLVGVRLASHVEPLTFRFEMDGALDCKGPDPIEVLSAEANGNPVTPLEVVQDADPFVAFIVMPSDTPPGDIEFHVRCSTGSNPPYGEQTSGTEWAAIAVTKAVTGAVPAGTTFGVHVDCVGTKGVEIGPAVNGSGTFAADLQYGATGGVRYVYLDQGADCTITEPVTGGATTSTVDPGAVEVSAPASYTVTVTNTFPAAVAPAAAEVTPAFTG